ncbi:MAG TPA: Rne/Rng family ribonuclease [Myxococcota bacterium]|nr:Rne/Rng family ribonuclease [Myxococcota bacterium]HOD07025.1 Rne/Rng family ribonuclease [Myxococcota bacterium]HPB49631.1 Rne/Rng family ribonuclease [Myxococcota bacterium]HQP94901.1 Rne/Rng family ribonuclease [Myxococcota bacterium]
MARRIVISADPYEARAALLDGDLLTNLEIESAGSNRRRGNLYRGRVTTVEKSLDAAFVDYGTGKEGFLPLDEVNERSLIELSGKSAAANGHVSLGAGDVILVQVAKEEVGKKGAALTMNVSNPGRFLVLMPFSSRTGVSRKLSGDDRLRLKDSLDHLNLPKGFGCIIRTVSDQSDETELQADLDHLVSQWKQIVARFAEARKPGEIHEESSLALRFVRDYMDSDVDDVLVEDEVTWREINAYFDAVMPGRSSRLKRYSGDLPLFVKYNVDRQVEALLRNRVTLPSGGSIVIGQTEALTAIDVNSGRTKKGAIEDTAFKTNVEAAVEIARQVILRDIGGIIVVDFIDMESEGHRHDVEETLRKALSRDKARLTVSKIRDFGLLAFSRQRLRHTVEEGIMSACPACSGTGRIRAPGPLAMSILRRLRERIANMTGDPEMVEVTVSIDVANFLNNRKREELMALEKRHGMTIEILGTPDVMPDDMQVTIHEDLPEDRQISRQRIEPADEVTPPAATATTPQRQSKPSEPAQQAAPRPKQKPSLLRGLLARLLDIDEYDEVQVKDSVGKGPVSKPIETPPTPPARPQEPARAPVSQPSRGSGEQQRKPRPPRQPRQEGRATAVAGTTAQAGLKTGEPPVQSAAKDGQSVAQPAPQSAEQPAPQSAEQATGQTAAKPSRSRNARRRAAQKRAREAAAMTTPGTGTGAPAAASAPADSATEPAVTSTSPDASATPMLDTPVAKAKPAPRQRRPRQPRPAPVPVGELSFAPTPTPAPAQKGELSFAPTPATDSGIGSQPDAPAAPKKPARRHRTRKPSTPDRPVDQGAGDN